MICGCLAWNSIAQCVFLSLCSFAPSARGGSQKQICTTGCCGSGRELFCMKAPPKARGVCESKYGAAIRR